MASSSAVKKKRTDAPKKKASGASKTRATAERPSGKNKAPVPETVPVHSGEPKERPNPLITREAALWLWLAVCVFLFISYFGVGGYLGEALSDFSFGLFGVMAYIFPVLLFVSAAFWIVNHGRVMAGVKFGAAVVLYLCSCSFAALVTSSFPQNLQELSKAYRGGSYENGGGAIGGAVCGVLCPALGSIGAGILLAVLAVVCLVLITQKSLINSMKKQSSRVVQSAMESSRRRREARREQEDWLYQNRIPKEGEPGGFPAESKSGEYSAAPQGAVHTPDADQAMNLSAEYRSVPGASAERDPLKVERKEYHGKGRHRKAAPEAEIRRKAPQDAAKYQDTSEAVAGEARRREEREIDVPVIFPVQPRRHRVTHPVGNIEESTRITGDPGQVAAEIHEIFPSAASRRSPEKFTERESENCFIDLEEPDNREAGRISDEELWSRSAGRQNAAETDGRSRVSQRNAEATEKDDWTAETTDEETDENHSRFGQKTAGTDRERMPLHIEGVEPDKPSEKFLPESAAASFRTAELPEEEEEEEENTAAVRSGMREGSEKVSEKFSEKSQEAPSGTGKKRNSRSTQAEIEEGIASVEAEAAQAAKAVIREYVFPPLELLHKGTSRAGKAQEQEIRKTAAKLQQTLDSFGVGVTVTNVSCGPSVTRYELLPEQGVKVSRIVALTDDIKLNLAAADIRIEAPIPGKSAVGIEVPNAENSTVALRDLLESDEFQKHKSKLAFATGKDIGGRVVVSDIAKMPHLLIAGATGSGKSVCINTLIMSILYKAKPDEVKLIMIDPKVVELSVYNGIPHLFIPVVTDPKKAAGALNWAVAEMTDRYNKFAEVGVRDLKGYNQKIETALGDVEDENKPQKLPQIVIIVDELADLMMVAPGEVEDSICRLAQLARAAGLHLIIATQRPSVNVITGLIKANMPSRIAFSVSSGVDSRTIIDMNGAEKLLGKGDMLFYPQGYQKPARVQGAFVSDEEVSDVVDFLKEQNSDVSYDHTMQEQIARVQEAAAATRGGEDTDELFADAGKFIIEKDKASIGMLQRVFKIGFNRAARIMDQLADAGVVGPEEGTKPRKILMSEEEFENYIEQN